MTYLDTHAAVWLRFGDRTAFDRRSRIALEADDEILISPMVVFELQVLFEKKRVDHRPEAIVRDLAAFGGVRICDFPFRLIVERRSPKTGRAIRSTASSPPTRVHDRQR